MCRIPGLRPSGVSSSTMGGDITGPRWRADELPLRTSPCVEARQGLGD